MSSSAMVQTPAPPMKWMLWTGRVVSALPALMLVLSGAMKLSHAPDFVSKWTGTLGFSESSLTGVGLLELGCVALYVFPRTAVLGAALIGCYLGGATCAHVRIGDFGGAITPILLGAFAWLGLYLREERLRALLPIRRG